MPDREKVLKGLAEMANSKWLWDKADYWAMVCRDALELLNGQELDVSKYQHKIDHTDCIWYSDSESRCPVTCSQYRDGWNDAMDFIFKNGAGYSPYKRR